MRISGKIDGLQEIFSGLQFLKDSAANRIVRRMVNVGSTPILRAAKAKCPTRASAPHNIQRMKLLRKSLGKKTKTYPGRGRVAVIIGPRVGFKAQIGVRTRGKNKGQPIYEDPAKIAHLVEYGHAGPHPAPPHPFMRPAFDEQKGAAKSAMIAAARDQLAKEVAKLAKKL